MGKHPSFCLVLRKYYFPDIRPQAKCLAPAFTPSTLSPRPAGEPMLHSLAATLPGSHLASGQKYQAVKTQSWGRRSLIREDP